jgi:cell division protein FtsB
MAEYPRVSSRFASRVKKSGLRSKLKMFFITAATVFLVISFFWGEFGFFRMWILSRRIDKLEKQIKILKVQRQDLLWEIDKMKNDPEYIQRYAIETFGYARPDQKVIQFVRPDSSRTGLVKRASGSSPRPR